jgi:hypothetical protein
MEDAPSESHLVQWKKGRYMNSTQTTPAVCEIDNCGIQAIGRCTTCKRAFCVSHQARERNGWFTYADMCSPCFAKTPREVERTQQAKREAEALEEYHTALRYCNGPAQNALRVANVPTVEIYQIEEKFKQGFFRDRWIDVVTPRGHGWVLPIYDWKCVLPDTSDSQVPWLAVVEPYAGGYAFRGKGLGSRQVSTEAEWVAVAKAVKRLTGEPG